MPYLYAVADNSARTGDPFLRPVFYDYPQATHLPCDQSWTFTVGGRLLVAPPPAPESPQAYGICLPAGGWFDYWTGKRVTGEPVRRQGLTASPGQGNPNPLAGDERITATPRLDLLPVFVRAGTILPRQAVVQSTAETPAGPLQLDVYPGDGCSGTLYLDDGHSLAYRRGGFLRQEIRCRVTPAGLVLEFGAREGRFAPWWREIAVTVHGVYRGRVMAGRTALHGAVDVASETLSFTLPDRAGAASVTIGR